MKIKNTVYVELTLYLGLGLSVFLVWDAVLEQMHHGELLLIAGELAMWPWLCVWVYGTAAAVLFCVVCVLSVLLSYACTYVRACCSGGGLGGLVVCVGVFTLLFVVRLVACTHSHLFSFSFCTKDPPGLCTLGGVKRVCLFK